MFEIKTTGVAKHQVKTVIDFSVPVHLVLEIYRKYMDEQRFDTDYNAVGTVT